VVTDADFISTIGIFLGTLDFTTLNFCHIFPFGSGEYLAFSDSTNR
jgi:hypothetical protein